MNASNVFIPFEGVTKNEDGTCVVYGKVTSERLDADGQITDLNWFRSQLPDWSKWSNIREMHRASAVGVGLNTEDTGDAIFLEAKIVDKEAALKCTEGVYKGFSYGLKGVPGNPFKVIKDVGAPNGRIVGGALVEISLCDRPSNPETTFSVVKNTEVIDKEVEDVKALAQAADLIASVAPVQGVDKGMSVSADLSLRTGVYVEGMSYEEAIDKVLEALGLKPSGHESMKNVVLEVKKTTADSEGVKVIDKAALAEVIKGLTIEERTELGLVHVGPTQEEFDALKAEMVEMGKAVKPTGLHMGAAIPVLPKSHELAELEVEKAQYEELTKAANPMTAQLAELRLVEINKAIIAAQAIVG